MRKSISTLCALALGVFGFTSVAAPTETQAQTVEGPKITWRLSLWGKRRAFTESLEYVSAEVAKRTAGNFQIKLYYGDQLSKNKENLDGISLGAFEEVIDESRAAVHLLLRKSAIESVELQGRGAA